MRAIVLCIVVACSRLAHAESFASEDPARVFSEVYSRRTWGVDGGGSGSGSTLHATHGVRDILHDFFKRNNVSTLADVPCGSFLWMRAFLARNRHLKYVGFDVAASIVAPLQKEYANKTEIVSFHVRAIGPA